ncbi:unnamed protein product [Strongylus vulgaris]|uniref:Elongation factor G-like domain-containing protein n=1 Tax=Strongylus vulgaris TaxID=40348 RepID=A0A3P7IGJ4_STRVU|nr:unnamed protein product [Strongylus vulgaris]
MSLFLEQHNGDPMVVPSASIAKALREITLSNRGASIGCGSALRCPASVQPVLDYTVQFLPSPMERNVSLTKFFGDELCGLVFKCSIIFRIGHDKRKGKLSYIRVYTGTLTSNSVLFNSSRGISEGPIKLFLAQSSELIPVTSVTQGNIAVVTGLSSALTGDTLLASEAVGHHAAHARHELKNLEKMQHDTHRKEAHNIVATETNGDPLDIEIVGDGQNVALKGTVRFITWLIK